MVIQFYNLTILLNDFLIALLDITASVAPATCATTYGTKSFIFIFLFNSNAIDTAGLKCPPDNLPPIKTHKARVPPIANGFPRDNTIDKRSAKVPINSCVFPSYKQCARGL